MPSRLLSSVDRVNVIAVMGMLAVAGYLLLLTHAMGSWTYDRWMMLILVPVLLALGIAIIVAVTRNDAVPLTRLIIGALVVKLVAAYVRYVVVFDIYSSGDAYRYDSAGAEIANAFHSGLLPLSGLIPSEVSTPFIEQATGLLYTLMGPSRPGGFVVFSWLAFWGVFLFYRAALIGIPEADHSRYALLIFFLPSMLFWPASIGKEALIMLALGASAYGAARVLERRPRGWIPLILGWGLAYMIRPHVAALLIAAFALALLLRRRGHRAPVFGPASRLLMVAGLVVAMSFVLGQAVDRYLPDEQEVSAGPVSPSLNRVGELFDRATTGTDQGGSVIETVQPTNVLDYPQAAFTVLFRPTLFEVNSITALFAAIETTGLLLLFVLSWRRVRNLPVLALRRPYLMMAVAYSGVFVFAWSSFANLGALARQRVQLWPFLLLLVVLPVALEQRRTRASTSPRPLVGAREQRLVGQDVVDEPAQLYRPNA